MPPYIGVLLFYAVGAVLTIIAVQWMDRETDGPRLDDGFGCVLVALSGLLWPVAWVAGIIVCARQRSL